MLRPAYTFMVNLGIQTEIFDNFKSIGNVALSTIKLIGSELNINN